MRRATALFSARAAPSAAGASRGAARRLYATSSESSVLDTVLPATGAGKHRLYHYTSIGLVTLIPIAMVAPSSVVLPVDLALGFLLPIHAHIGMAHIVEDYVPKAGRTAAGWGLMLATGVAVAGLLKLNVTGSGLTSSVKTLWRKEPLTTTQKESSTA